MKFTKNTIYNKIQKMKNEIDLFEQELNEFRRILLIDDENTFRQMMQDRIKEIPKLDYLTEEMESLKECMISAYEGNETKGDAMVYLNFFKKAVENLKE